MLAACAGGWTWLWLIARITFLSTRGEDLVKPRLAFWASDRVSARKDPHSRLPAACRPTHE